MLWLKWEDQKCSSSLISRGMRRSVASLFLSFPKFGSELISRFLIKVLAIMAHWPGSFKNEAALALGFHRDDVKTGFADAVRDFKAELEVAK